MAWRACRHISTMFLAEARATFFSEGRGSSRTWLMTLRWITLEDTDSSRLIKQIAHSSAASRLRPGKASPMSESNDTTTRTLADTEWDAVTGGSTVGALGYTIHIPMGLPVPPTPSPGRLVHEPVHAK